MSASPWPPARVLYDIAQTFEAADDPEARVRRALVLLAELVPHDRCALLRAEPGRERTFVVLPALPADDDDALRARLDQLLAFIVDSAAERAPSPAKSCACGPHLAVPLLELDQVVGILFVASADDVRYDEQHVCLLSIVAAQIATYLAMLRHAKEKDEFLAAISHELRTPLQVVLGWTSMVRSGALGAAGHARAMDAIARGAAKLGRLVEDLVDLSRVATGKLRLDLTPITLAPSIKAAIEGARPAADAGGTDLRLTIDDPELRILGDAERVEQVVSNLIGNAVKFTPRGGSVHVRLDHVEHHARIRVVDDGVGIAVDLLPHIFERFRQADAQSRRGRDGLGLGLAIVSDIVALHGGCVYAESPGVGRGATFTVELPLI